MELGIAGGRQSFRRRRRASRSAPSPARWRGRWRAPNSRRTAACGSAPCRCDLQCALPQECSCEDLRHASEGGLGAGFDGGRAAVEEAGLAQAHDQAVRLHAQRDFIALDLGGQGFLQFSANGIEVFLLMIHLLQSGSRARQPRQITCGIALLGVLRRRGCTARQASWRSTVARKDAELLEGRFNRASTGVSLSFCRSAPRRTAPRRKQTAG